MIDITNYEEYLMLRLDGGLSAPQEAELEAFLMLHPELEGEVAAYAATVLVPEETVVYNGKEALYKSVARPFYLRPALWAAAAVLLVAIGIKLAPEKDQPAVVTLPKKEQKASVQMAAPPATTIVIATPPPPVVEKVPVKESVAVVKTKQPTVERGTAFPDEQKIPVETSSTIALLEARSDEVLDVANSLPAAPQLKPVETGETAAVIPEKTSRIAMQLPILNSIKEATKAKLPSIQFAGEGLRGTQTTVMLFDRKLFTINF